MPEAGSEPPSAMLAAELGGRVRAAFTRRTAVGHHPGASLGDHAGANLAQHVGDDPEHVAVNRGHLAAWAGAPVVFGRQVHGVRAVQVDLATAPADPLRHDLAEPSSATGSVLAGSVPAGSVPAGSVLAGSVLAGSVLAGSGAGGPEAGCDALVTVGDDLALGVLVADCVPVLLADPLAGVVAVAHAGRVGLLDGVLDAVLQAMRDAGADLARVGVALGPSAGGCCYEVPEAMFRDAVARIPALAARTTWGTTALDLRAGCRALLAGRVARVSDVGGCTITDPGSFSHRRAQQEGRPATGRFCGVVRLGA